MRNKEITVLVCLFISIYSCGQQKNKPEVYFEQSFKLDSCKFSSTGRNQFFILEPGYQLILQGKENKEMTTLVVTVLDETKKVGEVETRVVEEKESVDGNVVEISKNYFAFCQETNNIFYFGEDVDNYKNGKIKDHEGAWIAEGKNKPGMMMPGKIKIGYKYYQEVAPGVAMDRAEIVSNTDKLKTAAGDFINCLKTEETTPLSPREKEYKIYAPGIGLIKDGDLTLVKYGFIK
jgi:hypothetical protein